MENNVFLGQAQQLAARECGVSYIGLAELPQEHNVHFCCPARARSARARRARALRALGLLLADGTPTGGRGEDFLSRQPDFFTETAVTPERKVEKSFPRWEINRHVEG